MYHFTTATKNFKLKVSVAGQEIISPDFARKGELNCANTKKKVISASEIELLKNKKKSSQKNKKMKSDCQVNKK